MARFFIDRPIFAWVIAIVIMLSGALAVMSLPVQQYPSIAPPSVRISGVYPGASAKTVEDSITQIVEQNMNGLDNLLYMSASSSSSGSFSITLTFDTGTDPDIAQVQVQNKIQQVQSSLPEIVRTLGVTVSKSSASFLMVVGFSSSNDSMTATDLADYVINNVQDPLSRVSGVGEAQVFGGQYAMRIWLDPNKLSSFNMTPADVTAAIRTQNTQVSVGQLGDTPSVPGQQINFTITAQGQLESVEDFARIMLRVNSDGSQVRLKDVARIELGSESYGFAAKYNNKTATGLAIRLATGANALQVADDVRAKMKELEPGFPEGLEVVYPFDTTPFIRISIEEVVKTLFEAIALVFLVMLLFLQNIRATLIPTIAVPVVLLGTFGIMSVLGYSINTLTMFGLVLAIGLLVDDAIVVVENVERVMMEEGLSPREATRKSMGQITGALVGIALVLSAVFIPMAFFGGATGAIYKQFSMTIVSAMVLSVVVAIVLTPALCATMLKPVKKGDHGIRRGPFGWFNRGFEWFTSKYRWVISKTVTNFLRYLVVYVLIVGGLGYLWTHLSSSFLPEEDQGALMGMVQLPTGASLERTEQAMAQVQAYFDQNESENVEAIFQLTGFSFAGQGQNMGMMFVKLKNWDERTRPDQSASAIASRAFPALMQIKEAQAYIFNVPAMPELGTANGFNAYLQDVGNVGHDGLLAARNQLLGMAAQNPVLTSVRPNGMEDSPQFYIDVDYEKAMAQGVSPADINNTLSIAWASSYVNDFVHRGRVKRVYVQSDAPYRMNPEDLSLWNVRNSSGEMVPFDAFATTEWSYGSPGLTRFNGLSSMNIQGSAAAGYSSGEAMMELEKLVKQLPPGVGLAWDGISYQEQQAGNQSMALYAISLIVVFLCLAALYESWTIPFSVMLIVPLGIFGAIAATYMRGLTNDIYFQVGLLTTIGLSAKNAILIVEFAKSLYDQGMDLVEATVEACRMRLRPIVMTSLAFCLGVLPLAISTGAGAGARIAIGTGVLGGMIAATLLAIFFVPMFYVLVMKLFGGKRQIKDSNQKNTE